jgi:hypothetical protein
MMTNTKKFETTSFSLHLMAMLFMLCDHLWGTIVPGNDWLTCIGRVCFPIYAFLLVEGYFHTSNLKKYVKRLLLFAVISEIPFNLAMASSVIYPFHQNVLWSFLIALGLIHCNEKAKSTGKLWLRIIVAVFTILAGYLLGLITMVDYYHAGILMVLTFYFFHHRNWWDYVGQLLCLGYINLELLGGFGYEVVLFGETVFLTRQGLALLALIPIWLYKGKQGYHSKWWKYFCYAFYPVHLLILGLLKFVL